MHAYVQIIGDSLVIQFEGLGLVMDPKSRKAKHSFGPCGCYGMDVTHANIQWIRVLVGHIESNYAMVHVPIGA